MSHLKPVPELFNTETGEITKQACPHCAETAAQLAGAEREIRSWRSRYAKLERDKKEEAETHTLWGIAIALFNEWRLATGHERSAWTSERFWICQPFLERERFTACRYAVWGIAAHPNRKEITPDYFEVYDSFELVFRNQDTFERYANRGCAVFGKELPIPASLKVPEWLNVPRYSRLSPMFEESQRGNEGVESCP
jgi:transcriptional regulator with XRE-family HTH domain